MFAATKLENETNTNVDCNQITKTTTKTMTAAVVSLKQPKKHADNNIYQGELASSIKTANLAESLV